MIEKNNKMPLLSVIIPVYNSEKWLPDCINSLMNQTMEDIEYIFVDDKSTDNSIYIIQNMCKFDNRFQLLMHDSNKRQGGARNTGILATNTDYIGFCDSDDFVAPDFYEKLYQRIIQTNSDIVYAQAARIPEQVSYKEIDQINDLSPYIKWNSNLLKWDDVDLNDHGKCDIIAYEKGGVYTSIVRKNIIIDNNIWFPENTRFEDNYWGSLLMPYINKISFVKSIGYYYRQNRFSTVNEREGNQYFERITIEKSLLAEVKRRKLYERYYSAWEYIYAYRYGLNTISLLMSRFKKVPYNIIGMIRKDLDKTFPKWRRNKYWKERYGFVDRLCRYFKIYCPSCFVTIRNIIRG